MDIHQDDHLQFTIGLRQRPASAISGDWDLDFPFLNVLSSLWVAKFCGDYDADRAITANVRINEPQRVACNMPAPSGRFYLSSGWSMAESCGLTVIWGPAARETR
jgi:hypothetical protein